MIFIDNLKDVAYVHKFRDKNENETEKEYRLALAKHVWITDRIKAHEIRICKGWREWNHDKCLESYKEPVSLP